MALLLGERVRGPGLAEHVNVCRGPLLDDSRQHRAGDEVDVCRAVGGILGRHDVRPEEGDVRGDLAGQPQ